MNSLSPAPLAGTQAQSAAVQQPSAAYTRVGSSDEGPFPQKPLNAPRSHSSHSSAFGMRSGAHRMRSGSSMYQLVDTQDDDACVDLGSDLTGVGVDKHNAHSHPVSGSVSGLHVPSTAEGAVNGLGDTAGYLPQSGRRRTWLRAAVSAVQRSFSGTAESSYAPAAPAATCARHGCCYTSSAFARRSSAMLCARTCCGGAMRRRRTCRGTFRVVAQRSDIGTAFCCCFVLICVLLQSLRRRRGAGATRRGGGTPQRRRQRAQDGSARR